MINNILLLIIFACLWVYPVCFLSKKLYLAGNRIEKLKYLFTITLLLIILVALAYLRGRCHP